MHPNAAALEPVSDDASPQAVEWRAREAPRVDEHRRAEEHTPSLRAQTALSWAVIGLASLVAADILPRLLLSTVMPPPTVQNVLWVTFPFALGIFARSVLDVVRESGQR